MLHTKEATKCTIKKHSNEEMECHNVHVINTFFVITYYLCTKQCVVTAVFCWCQHKKQLHLLRLNFFKYSDFLLPSFSELAYKHRLSITPVNLPALTALVLHKESSAAFVLMSLSTELLHKWHCFKATTTHFRNICNKTFLQTTSFKKWECVKQWKVPG